MGRQAAHEQFGALFPPQILGLGHLMPAQLALKKQSRQGRTAGIAALYQGRQFFCGSDAQPPFFRLGKDLIQPMQGGAADGVLRIHMPSQLCQPLLQPGQRMLASRVTLAAQFGQERADLAHQTGQFPGQQGKHPHGFKEMIQAALQGRVVPAAEESQERVICAFLGMGVSKGTCADKTPLTGDDQFIEQRVFLPGWENIQFFREIDGMGVGVDAPALGQGQKRHLLTGQRAGIGLQAAADHTEANAHFTAHAAEKMPLHIRHETLRHPQAAAFILIEQGLHPARQLFHRQTGEDVCRLIQVGKTQGLRYRPDGGHLCQDQIDLTGFKAIQGAQGRINLPFIGQARIDQGIEPGGKRLAGGLGSLHGLRTGNSPFRRARRAIRDHHSGLGKPQPHRQCGEQCLRQ